MLDVVTRAARRDEAMIGSRLLFLSGPELFAYSFNQNPEKTQTILARLWPREGHLFSYQWAHMTELDSQPVGILSGFTAPQLRRASSRMMGAFARVMWPWQVLRMLPHTFELSGLSADVADGDFYVANVAVLPEYRSRGIGRHMLARADEQARSLNCQRCVLDVVIENVRARQLYEAVGYVVTDTRTNPRLAQICGVSGMHRMTKLLT